MAAICVGTFTSGSGQYLTKASLAGAPNLRASHTFMFRLKNTGTSTTINSVVATFDNNALTTGSVIGRNNGVGTSSQMRWYRINTTGTADAANYGTCYGNTTTWYHIAFVYNATTQNIRCYIDGVYIGQHSSLTTRPSSSTTNTFLIGQHPGKYADAAFFDRALTDQEVADMAAYRVCQVTSGLLGFWRLDSNGNDSSGNGQNFTSGGTGTAVSYSTADNPPQPETPIVDLDGGASTASTLSGSLTKSFALAGAPSTASTLSGTLTLNKALTGDASSASTLTGDLRLGKQLAAAATTASSLAAWIRPRWGRRVENGFGTLVRTTGTVPVNGPWTLMTWLRVVSNPTPTSDGAGLYIADGSAAQAQLYWSVVSGTPRLRFAVWDSTGTLRINSTSATTDNSWHHLAITYDGVNTATCYIDGSSVASSSAMSTSGAAVFANIVWDSYVAGVGEFAHAKLWAAQLTAAEIVQEKDFYTPAHHNTKLYGWWQLGWQNVTLDSSGNGHALTDNGSTEAQTESPGLPLTDLAGAASSASTLAGTLSQQQPLVGPATSASTLAGTLSQAQPLTGAASSASSLAGTLSQTQPLVGPASSASSLAGTLSQAQPLTGAASTASTLTGALSVAIPLAGGASTASSLAGTLGQALVLAGGATTTSRLTGALGIEGAFSGNALTASTLAGTLSVDKPIAGAASTASSLTGVLSQLQPLNGAASSASSLAGAMTVIKQAEGAASTSTALAGTLSVANALTGAASTASTLSGTLSLTQQLAAAAQSASTLTGNLTVQNVLGGAATSSSHLAGTLNVDVIWYLSAIARTGSYLTGALTVTVPASASGNVVTDGNATAYYGDVIGPLKLRRRRGWPPRPR